MKNLEDLEVVAVDLEMSGYKARLGNTQFDFIYAKFGQFLLDLNTFPSYMIYDNIHNK